MIVLVYLGLISSIFNGFILHEATYSIIYLCGAIVAYTIHARERKTIYSRVRRSGGTTYANPPVNYHDLDYDFSYDNSDSED